MPETRKAFASGELSESRVRVLAQAQALAPEQFAQDEATLVAQAAQCAFQQGCRRCWPYGNATLIRPGAQVEAERLHALRVLHLSPDWSGMTAAERSAGS